MGNSTNEQTDTSVDAAAVLPEYWPVAEPLEVVRAVWLPWLIAVVLAPLFWLMPRRLGPHFAAAGWRAAIAAHVVWVAYGVASLYMLMPQYHEYTVMSWMAGHTPEQLGRTLLPVPTLWEALRAPLGLLAMLGGMTNTSAIGMSKAVDLVQGVLYLLAGEVGLVVLAVLLMPYMAVGEWVRRLLGRAVRLVLWATTSLVVLALVLQALDTWHVVRDEPAGLVIALYVAWAISLVIRGGDRYAGEPAGPAWEPRRVQCESCGYCLTGLPAGGTCPECGAAIARSLAGRRQPSGFREAKGMLGRLRRFPGTVRMALPGGDFYRNILIRGELSAARRFAVWVCAVTGTFVAFLWAILAIYKGASGQVPGWTIQADLCVAGEIWCGTTVALVLLAGVVGLLSSRFGRRRLDVYCVAVFYGASWVLPVVASCAVPVAILACMPDFRDASAERHILPMMVVGLSLFVIPIWLGWRGVVRVRRAIGYVRYANG